jgi:hypothetical protein
MFHLGLAVSEVKYENEQHFRDLNERPFPVRQSSKINQVVDFLNLGGLVKHELKSVQSTGL